MEFESLTKILRIVYSYKEIGIVQKEFQKDHSINPKSMFSILKSSIDNQIMYFIL